MGDQTAGEGTLDGTMRRALQKGIRRVPTATCSPHIPTRQFQKGPIQAVVTSVFEKVLSCTWLQTTVTQTRSPGRLVTEASNPAQRVELDSVRARAVHDLFAE